MKPVDDFPRNRSARFGRGSYYKSCHNRITRRDKEKHGEARNYHLRRRYGITVEHFDRMLAEQHGRCAICHEAPAEHVDHDHETGRVRGLLCFNCNGALGQFRDRTDLMLRAVAYLRRREWAELIDLPDAHVGFHIFGGGVVDAPDDDGPDSPMEARRAG